MSNKILINSTNIQFGSKLCSYASCIHYFSSLPTNKVQQSERVVNLMSVASILMQLRKQYPSHGSSAVSTMNEEICHVLKSNVKVRFDRDDGERTPNTRNEPRIAPSCC
jgi:hypothetical protein